MSIQRVAILYGGPSPEAEISKKSAEEVKKALDKLGYEAFLIEFSSRFIADIKSAFTDKVFICMHGIPGEEGRIQGTFELINIPYTGSSYEASFKAADKEISKLIFVENDIPTPKYKIVKNEDDLLTWNIFPAIIKPCKLGSSIGVRLIKDKKEIFEVFESIRELDEKFIIEEFIDGKELSIGVLNGKSLEVVEIIPQGKIFSYEDKYISSHTQYICPANIEEDIRTKIKKYVQQIWNIFNFKGAVRIDLRLKDDEPYFLEVNTIPGLTRRSLLPLSAQGVGISFEDLIHEILLS
jgi:D-alanine-D-alanine ligase